MTDIVKRLRRYCADTGLKSHTIDEAADEIERLRQQVQHANDHADAAIKDMELMREALRKVLELSAGDSGWARQIARAALEESK